MTDKAPPSENSIENADSIGTAVSLRQDETKKANISMNTFLLCILKFFILSFIIIYPLFQRYVDCL